MFRIWHGVLLLLIVFRLVHKPKVNSDWDSKSKNDAVILNERRIYKHEEKLDQEIDLDGLQPPWWWIKNHEATDKNAPHCRSTPKTLAGSVSAFQLHHLLPQKPS